MEMELRLDKSYRYLLGVSGGSDSMTLLSLCVNNNLDVIVAHVNYKLRANADKEEELLKKYCEEKKIKVYTLYPKQVEKENFQKWARDVRYSFYKDVYDKEDCQALLLGHQKDDHIENYLMSLKRGSHGWYYGIKEETCHHGMTIIRPLLNWRKRETREYCLTNNIPFGDDESNFQDKYTRNQIRHSIIEKADDRQIELWIHEIESLNKQLSQKRSYIEKYYNDEEIKLESFNREKKEDRLLIIRFLLEKYLDYNLNNSFVEEIDSALLNKKANIIISLNNNYALYKEYGVFYVYYKDVNYSYELTEIAFLQTPYFSIKEEGKTIEQVCLKEEDFPIKIRNSHNDDVIELRLGHKKVNRFMIDHKIKHKERMTNPVVVNKKGEVIFVGLIGCDINHYSTKENVFVVK